MEKGSTPFAQYNSCSQDIVEHAKSIFFSYLQPSDSVKKAHHSNPPASGSVAPKIGFWCHVLPLGPVGP